MIPARPPGWPLVPLRRRELLISLTASAAASSAPSAWSQPVSAPAWPQRPLRIVVPFPAGGASEVAMRLLAPELQRSLGQPVTVEARAGAGGNIGSAEVAGASDGHTFLMAGVSTHVINPLLSRRLPYDPVRDFAPVCLVATVPRAWACAG
jgi:tripartite-type tricarboxylate transporter receptor subunit TctC